MVLWVPMCLLAGWWQVTRALDGNGLSYLYSVEWPIFAIVGVFAWWSLVHTDPDSVGARAQRRLLARAAGGSDDASGTTGTTPARDRQSEDTELAAYNDRLADLAASNRPKTWRRP